MGLLALGIQAVFERAADWAATAGLPAVCDGEGACAASGLLTAALIPPASVRLGTTFPPMVAGDIARVDTIKIEPMMVQAAQLFRPRNAKVLDNPRSRVFVDDTRAHVAKTRARYDLIILEPSNPWISGVAGLFTVEFYRNVAPTWHRTATSCSGCTCTRPPP